MAERKFTRALSKPGTAAQARETVSQAVRESTELVRHHLVEPLDYELFVSKNKTILQNDPQREMLFFPMDDISQEVIPRANRTTVPTIPSNMCFDSLPLFVRQCIKTYTADWHTVVYRFSAYSGTYKELLRLPRPTDLQDQVYEVDTETEVKDSDNNTKGDSEIIKEGYILKGPESGTDSFISLATKSFKRRYLTLRREVDGTHILEFFKDDKRSDSKGTICMDFCSKVVRNSKRSKLSFELRMQDGHKSCVLAAESEVEMDGWMAMLVAITTNYRNALESSKKPLVSPEENIIPLPPSPYGYGTLKSLEHSKNPDLVKYARETDYSIAQARKQNRQNLFSIYPDLQKSSSGNQVTNYERSVEPYKEEFNTRLFVRCEEVRFKLQAPLDCEKGSLCQVEPYITTMSVYDVRRMRKVSEDFRFDVNNAYLRNMLPKTMRRKSNSGSSNGTAAQPSPPAEPILPGISELGEEWLAFPKQAVFTVQRPEPELFLVVRIEKVLQGNIAQASEPYLRHGSLGDAKQGTKAQKLVRTCCQRLGHYRMPFAWAAKAIFTRFSCELDKSLDFGHIYRHDSAKLSEEDILKFLFDLRRPEKAKHFTVIPGQIKVTLKSLKPDDQIENSLTPSLVPVEPFPIPPKRDPTLEIQQFPTEVAADSHPFCSYLNHLYVYPRSLKYDSQKTFAKARNISCCVELRDRDEDGTKPLRCIYGRPGESLYVTQSFTAVTHHCVTPDFYEEVKIGLPLDLHDKHHLLFTFYHVSCDMVKATKRKDGPVETVVGYSWLPLLNKGRLNIEEGILPVASNLPAGYLSFKPLGLGKGFCGPDVRMVEGGRELFKVGFKLVSTVHTKDQHLQNFFVHCQKLLETKILGPDTETSTLLKEQAIASVGSEPGREISKLVKALHAVEGNAMVHFLPTVLNQLLRLIVSTGSEEVALNTVRVLIHLVTCVHEAGKEDVLHSYVQFMFVTEPPEGSQQTTVHEELAKSLAALLGPDNADFLVVHKFLHQSWFFFQILAKSMAQHLMNTDRIKMQRHERFSQEYHNRVRTLVNAVMPHILHKFKDLRNETRQANQGLAHFLKRCFSLMDRGFVFKLINSYLEKFKSGDEMELHCYKFEFLEIICSHEHFIALNLPSLKGTYSRGHSKNTKDYEMEYRLSEEFCRSHFLVGALLLELRAALSEVQKVRQRAIGVVCNLLAKHAFDDRYQGPAQQARIASLYLPLISVLLSNINRFSTSDQQAAPACHAAGASCATSPSRKTSKADSLNHMPDEPGTPPSGVSYRNSMMVDGPSSLPGSTRHNRDSNYLSIIAGQVPVPHMGVTFANGSCTSLESESSTPSSSSAKDVEPAMRNGDAGVDKCFTRDGSLMSKGHVRSQSLPFASHTGVVRYDKFEPAEIKDLLICFLYIIKQLNEDLLIGWWQQCRECDLLDFFHLLELCLHQFRYMGKKHILRGRNQQAASSQAKAMTLPARTAPPTFTQRCNSTYSENAAMENGVDGVDGDSFYRALLEANMATEVGLIALDVLGLYCGRFKDALLFNDGDNPVMRRLFDIYLSFLEVGQSENLLRHLFAALRAFINKFPVALFQGNAFLCGKLCFELLRCCNSKLSTVRSEACALLYLLMRSNFEFTGRKALTRVHLQLIVSVSRLLGEVIGLNTARFQESLSIINNYASGDKAMQRSEFPKEVKDLTKKIRTVLMATTQMREHENDPEMLVDLQHSLANSYSATPALRKTWLESMATYHLKNRDFTEAAQCYIHVAALEAEYLKHKGVFVEGCKAFKNSSPNVVRDESNLKDDTGTHDFQYTEDTLVERLEQCADTLHQAERYEAMAEMYRLIVPIYERRRNYEALAKCYKTLHQAYNKILEVNRTGKRLLGKYYRVAFFGQAYFGEDSGKEYIYKEPKVTSLPEISERLHRMFCEKFGKESVKIIMDSNQVNPDDLDPKYAYVQVTHVVPYFTEMEFVQRQTEFERHNNISEFMFETPFTLDGTKARGSPDEQCKRRTILTTDYSFPYVKKRIPVKGRRTKDLNPIEVAIDEMQTRVAELDEVVKWKPTDLKKLQLKLQGSIGVQVNAGPLAYANAFLEESKSHAYPEEEVTELKETYRQFLHICEKALELNGKLIPPEQCEYHLALKKNLIDLACQLSEITKEKFISEPRSHSLKRMSLEVFNFRSGSPGSSNV